MASVVVTVASVVGEPVVAMATAVAIVVTAVNVVPWALDVALVVHAVKVAMDSALQSGAGKHKYHYRFHRLNNELQ